MTAAQASADPLDARRERGMTRWRARSRLIHRLRIVLPAAMALILGVLAGWVSLGGLIERLREGSTGGHALIHMTNARFYGRDAQARPYVLGAAEASRGDKDLHRVNLIRPTLTLDAGGDRPSQLTADGGVYREDDRMVRLQGHVTVQASGGAVFRTDRAIIDTVKGVVAGPSPVVGTAPTGMITAHSFTIYDRGARVVFRGEVHSVMKRD
jgi:lipopolysaccharide export system protein LptC